MYFNIILCKHIYNSYVFILIYLYKYRDFLRLEMNDYHFNEQFIYNNL